MSDDFLSRWSRRKREARKAGQAEDAQARVPVDTPPAAQVSPAAPLDAPDEPALTPDEIAALPKPDELTAESDFAAFLRKGVPETLRNEALRKAWALDPNIRDFVGHARDYAYDWNVAGGVPGTGALLPGDDVLSMVRQVLGAEPPAPAVRPAAPDELSPDREQAPWPSGTSAGLPRPMDCAAPDDAADPARTPTHGTKTEASAEGASAGTEAATLPAAPEGDATCLRRHGGAKPH